MITTIRLLIFTNEKTSGKHIRESVTGVLCHITTGSNYYVVSVTK